MLEWWHLLGYNVSDLDLYELKGYAIWIYMNRRVIRKQVLSASMFKTIKWGVGFPISALCLFGLVPLCMTVDKIDRVLKVNPKVYSNCIFKNMFEASSRLTGGHLLHKPEIVFFLWVSLLKMLHSILEWHDKSKIMQLLIVYFFYMYFNSIYFLHVF